MLQYKVTVSKVAVLAILACCIIAADGQQCSPACQNGGICLFSLSTGTSTCNCAGTGYTGATCSSLAGAPSNGTTSTPSNSSASSTASPPSSSSCSGQPCYHGVCQQEQDTSQLFCQCNSGYFGTFCNVTATALAPSTPSTPSTASTNQSCPITCYNGQCLQQYNSALYTCQCNAGYIGQTCNTRSSPAPSPSTANQNCPISCYNGQCLQQYNSALYTCQCNSGYTGQSCNQLTAASPSGVNVGCASGCSNGQCIAFSNGTSHCQCNNGWKGSSCSQRDTGVTTATENSSSGGGSHISGGGIFGIVVVVMLAVLALAVGGFLLWRRRRRETFVRFQDGQEGMSNVEIGKRQMSSGSMGLRSSTSALTS